MAEMMPLHFCHSPLKVVHAVAAAANMQIITPQNPKTLLLKI